MPTAAKMTSHKGGMYRMVFPAWRIMTVRVETEDSDDTVSREEIEGIFEDVLRADHEDMGLTPEELREKARTDRIRAALVS